MQFQYIPYIWPLLISGFVSLSLGIFSLIRQRHAKGAKSFILMMLVVTVWCFSNALEMSATDFSTKLFWANVQYIAYCFSPVTIILLCTQFTGYGHWTRERVLWLLFLPTITNVLVWTDGWHGLIRYDMYLDYSGSFPIIAKKYGLGFFVHVVYSHFLNITAWLLLVRTVFFKDNIYRKQAIALLLGLSLTLIPNILYISGISPIDRFDITPVFFGPAGLIIAWGIFRFKLFDIIPVARATVIETMDAGVMVLDLQNRVLDINPAFERIIGFNASEATARQIDEVCADIPEILNFCKDRVVTNGEFSVRLNGQSKIYEIFFSPLNNHENTLIGWLFVTYDITAKKKTQQKYDRQQRKLAISEERERLARDLHDNLGQVLSFINLQAQGIRQELINAGVEVAAVKLDKLIEVSQSAHQEIREYIRNVRSSAVVDQNFIASLTKDIRKFEKQTDIKINLDIPNGFTGEELEPNQRINLLYIFKEALNNIKKHARANHVKIAISCGEKELCATIEDDGKGFNFKGNKDKTKTHFGLEIMRERAVEIGSQIDIQSAVGEGARIAFCIPLKGGENKGEEEINAGR